MSAVVYKILRAEEWDALRRDGLFKGSKKDLEDGYVHLSTSAQAPETAEKHFAGVSGLILAEVDPSKADAPLKWEVSRGGALFPHLYGPLPAAAIARHWPLSAGFPPLYDPLDNAIWESLSATHAGFAQTLGAAKRFRPEVSILAGLKEPSEAAWRDLAELVKPGERVGLCFERPTKAPAGWELQREAPLFQMVHEGGAIASDTRTIVELGEADAAEMLALAQLTMPGPFELKTRELGTYLGIREGGKLVAMAGERLKLPGLTEVSAICTHPDHAGRGHARALTAEVAARIRARGETPFLHVRHDNERAIALYERMGLRTRVVNYYTILRREPRKS